jgi:hypothetical protein
MSRLLDHLERSLRAAGRGVVNICSLCIAIVRSVWCGLR